MKSDNLYFTADHHWGHANIVKYSKRLEFMSDTEKEIALSSEEDALRKMKINPASVARMNEAMIERWNAKVPKNGIVYHLGDIFLCSVHEAREIRSRLNGTIRLVEGNHDKTALQMRDAFETVRTRYEISIDDRDAFRGSQPLVLDHYAMRVWSRSFHGSWCLYGHSHGNLRDDPNSLSFDVGVDCHDFTPLSYQEVKDIMAKKTFTPIG